MRPSTAFKKYVYNTGWLFVEKCLRIVVGFSVGVWVARYLGPERLGILNYAQSFVFLFSAFATLGLDGIVIRELVKHPEKRDILLGTSFVLKLAGAVISISFLSVAIYLSQIDTNTTLIMLLFGFVVIFQTFNVIDFYFQSKVLSKYVALSQAISMVLISAGKIALILSAASLIWFAFVIAIEALLIACGLTIYYLKSGSSLRLWIFDRSVAKALIADSWPLILSALMVSLYMRIDQVMITHMISPTSNGYYAAAVKISELWYFIPTIIVGSVFPAVVRAKTTDSRMYNTRLQQLYIVTLWSSILIVLPIAFWSESIVNLLYGQTFAPAANVLKIHSWTLILVSLGVASSSWYISENLQKLAFARTFFGMVVNIILNSHFIPIWGIIGATYATLISYFVASFLFDFFPRKTRPVFVMKLRSFLFWRLYAEKSRK
jgi:O-antigen/teichoic acid export membrane protein